jgi:heme o synthase
MPVVAGEVSTRRQILVYTLLLLPLAVLPWWIDAAGAIYGISALVLSALFVALAIPVALRRRTGDDDAMKPERQLFKYSIIYLFAVFAALVADRWLAVLG